MIVTPDSEPAEIEAIPLRSYDLIDLLDRIYPHRCIGVTERVEDAHRYAGLRQLIDELVEMKRDELARTEGTA